MFNIIRKVFIIVVLLRVLVMVADVAHGPVRIITIFCLIICGIRFIFSKESDGD